MGRQLRLGVLVPSVERFVRMADENGHVVLNDDGIWQKRTDGSPLQFTDSIGRKFSPPLLRADFDAWCKARLISQDLSASPDHGVVFAITPCGIEAWTKLGGRRRLRKAAVGSCLVANPRDHLAK
jgi:hypothetical protein